MNRTKLLVCLAGGLLTLAAAAPAQTISIVSGQGQIGCATCPTGLNATLDPLIVKVQDANGTPVKNATVTWTVPTGAAYFPDYGTVSATTTTDSTGQSSIKARVVATIFGGNGQDFTLSTIRASIPTSAVTFTEVTALTSQNGLVINILSALSPESPQPGTTLPTGSVGQTSPVPIAITVGSRTSNARVPNVELRLVSTLGPAVSCANASPTADPGAVLTGLDGVATCNVLFGGPPGAGTFYVYVGGQFNSFGPYRVNVTQGAPANIKIISGNNQAGNPSTSLPSPLLAEVDDASGAPLPNVPLTWSITQGSATLKNPASQSDVHGRASTYLVLGNTAGPVSVKVQAKNNANVSATFKASVNSIISGLQIVGGNNQSAVINTQFAQPLTVQAVNNGQPVPGTAVTFAVTGGGATLSATSATTNAQGQASTTAFAGGVTGAVTITATSGAFSQTFNLTILPAGPNITSSSFYSAAGFQYNSDLSSHQTLALSPCSLGTVIGAGLAPGIDGVVTPGLFGPLPYQLANVTIKFGNTPAPLLSVANMNGQESVNFQVPCEVPPGDTLVTVAVGSGSKAVTIPVSAVSPGIFQTSVGMSDGVMRAVLVRPDGSFVSTSNPARRGENIRMYVTGLGQTTPPIGTNQYGATDVEQEVLANLIVGVSGGGAMIVSAKYSEALIGVYEVEFQVPENSATGNNVPFAIVVLQGSNAIYGNGSLIPVQ